MLFLSRGKNSIGPVKVEIQTYNLTILHEERPMRTLFCLVLYLTQHVYKAHVTYNSTKL